MKKILEIFLGEFFEDAFPFIDVVFSKLLNIVFFLENHISDGSIFENTVAESGNVEIFFNKLFMVTSAFGTSLLIFKFLKKIFDTYIIGTDGDATVSIENMLLGFIKGLIIIFGFKYFYGIFVNISMDFIDKILAAVGVATDRSLYQIYRQLILGRGVLFISLGVLVFFICYIILIFQFIKRGLEMFILRLGIPIACIGLVDSDNGVFAPYMKLFIQNTITVVIQIAMIKLGFNIISNGNIFFGIGAMIMGIKTPQFLQQFMIGVGGSGINMMSINQTASMVGRVTRIIKK